MRAATMAMKHNSIDPRYEFLFELAGEPLLLVCQGMIIRANDRARRAFGLDGTGPIPSASILRPADGHDRVRDHNGRTWACRVHALGEGEGNNEVWSLSDPLASDALAQEQLRSRMAEEVNEVLRTEIAQHRRTQEALAQSKRFARALVESSLDMIMAADPQGIITEFNPAASLRFGYEPEEAIGMNTRRLYANELDYGRVQRELNTHGAFAGEVRNIDREGREFTSFVAASRLYDEEGRLLGAMGVSRDITRSKRDQDRIQEQNAKLKALFESSEHMFWTVDRRIALTSFNKGYADMIERLYGIKPELNVDPGKPRKRFASKEYHEFWEARYADAFGGRPLRFETDLHDAEGRRVCNEIFLSPVFNAEGGVDEVFGVGHEITEQKEAEDLAREQGARLQAIFDSAANMMIWTLDRDLRLTSFNEHFHASVQEAHGIDYAIGAPFIEDMAARVAGGRPERFIAKYQSALKGYPQQFEAELFDRAGRPIWVENFLNPITENGRIVGLSCLAHGITEKKEAQARLLDSLKEKEVLLKEVHHRVKNNLQVISSILNLQSDHVDGDPRIMELLRDSQARIRSMSYIHESLYQRKNFNSVDIGAYIDGLARNLMMSYSLDGKVRLETEVESVELGLDQAIPCGLMINELISNALKHAFPGGREGTIVIVVEHVAGEVHIRVSDDGIGLPPDFDMERDANLGLQLVGTLIGQVDGRIDRLPGSGAGYSIRFQVAAARVPA